MAITISTDVDIDAIPERVWGVLTDFASYRDWNPFMDRVEGDAQVGRKLVVHKSPPGGRGMTFKRTVLVATPGQELRWLGKLAFGGLFDGEHSFVLSRQPDDTTRLTHSESFRGLLVGSLKGTLKGTDEGFVAFNQALKQRVEHVALAGETAQ